MRKGQTEIMGLLVIVILFIIIFFIFIIFSARNTDEKELRGSIESSNMLRAMMFYTPENCNQQIRDIAKECARKKDKLVCDKTCTEILDKEIPNILDAGMNKPYSFFLKAGSYQITLSNGECNIGIVDRYKTRDIDATIRIC